MIKLENLQGIKLSRGIKNLSPLQYDTMQIKNKLIDGSYHIQTIGEPLKFIKFEILSNHNQVNLINLAESIGEELKLIVDNKYYAGMLNDKLEWNRITMRYKNKEDIYYTSSVIFNIGEEGSI